jgi:hypothetical protein
MVSWCVERVSDLQVIDATPSIAWALKTSTRINVLPTLFHLRSYKAVVARIHTTQKQPSIATSSLRTDPIKDTWKFKQAESQESRRFSVKTQPFSSQLDFFEANACIARSIDGCLSGRSADTAGMTPSAFSPWRRSPRAFFGHSRR